MKHIGKALYIELDDFIKCGIKDDTVERGCRRGGKYWNSIKDPSDERCLLVQFDTLKDEYKDALTQHFGDAHKRAERLQNNKLTTLVKPAHYDYYALRLPASDAMQHAYVAGVFELLGSIRHKAALKVLGWENRDELFEQAFEWLQEYKVLRIANKRYLRTKIKQYQEDGPAALLNGRRGNQNPTKIATEAQHSYLIALAADAHKPSFPLIRREYNKEAVRRGWKEVTTQTVSNFLNDPKVAQLWVLGRQGKDYWRNQYKPTLLRSRPSAPDLLWEMDGTPLDLYYKRDVKKWNEKKGQWEVKTSSYNRMYFFPVIDAFSWKIIGYSVGLTEDGDTVRRAMKNAISTNMRVPRQWRYDNSKAIESQKWLFEQLETLGLDVLCTPAKPNEPQSKVIEGILGKFQQLVLRYFDNWAGMNVRTKKEDSHFNPDFLKAHKSDTPDLEQLLQQLDKAITVWNNMATKKREAPNKLYDAANSGGKIIETWTYVSMFWERSKGANLYHKDGIHLQIDNIEHVFQVIDAKFYKRYAKDRFEIVYDPDCLDYVYLYQKGKPVLDDTGQPLMAVAAEMVPMAAHDFKEGDRARLNKLLALQDEVYDEVKGELAAIQAENDLNLGHSIVFKDQLNAAETAYKSTLVKEVDWKRELENMYLDED